MFRKIHPMAHVLPELLSYLESLAEPHILLDRQYRILAANAAYRSQFSPRASVVGRTCYEVSHHFSVPCDQAGESCPLARARESGQRERVLHLHHTPQGESYVNIELVPLLDATGEQAYFVEKMEPLRVAQGQPVRQGLVGRSPAFQSMLELVARVGPSQASVLLLGESGTGKELVAQAVHDASPRATHPLVVVDCASLPETLFESELFGHERGAFTGAIARKIGLVEAASGGTLFLDEVGDIPLPLQVKLLRFLQERTIERIGGRKPIAVDTRIVCATHRDLDAMIAAQSFRDDLYYRLAEMVVKIPSLAERPGDAVLLARHFLHQYAPAMNPAVRGFAPDALQAIDEGRWPGNVRELENRIKRAVIMADGKLVMKDDLDLANGAADGEEAWLNLRSAREAADRVAIRRAMTQSEGNISAAAKLLGISRPTLYDLLKQYRMQA